MKEIHLMKVTQAAKYARVSRQTIYNWLANGKLTAYRGAHYRTNKAPWISPLDIDNLK